jgi:hypothetical protein
MAIVVVALGPDTNTMVVPIANPTELLAGIVTVRDVVV